MRYENGGGGSSSPGCSSMTEKSMESRSSRGGVPVFRRPTSNPKSRMQSDRRSADDSPARPAGKWFRADMDQPFKNVPEVSTDCLGFGWLPASVMMPVTEPARVSTRSTIPP